ncbi:MAG: hypothetical protein ACHP65_05270 [Legionellales bacterium]
MQKKSIKNQIHNNLVAIISLSVAISALSYNTWRNEKTERNRNIRPAAFEILKELGQLQLIVNNVRYGTEHSKLIDPILGWGHISFLSDLSQLLPQPIPTQMSKLVQVWQNDWEKIRTNEASADKITLKIDDSRSMVLNQLKTLK